MRRGLLPLFLLGCSTRAEPLASTPAGAPADEPVAPPTGVAAAAPAPEPPRPAPAPKKDDGPRVFAKSRFTWVHRTPDERSGWIGYLYLGGSVRVKGATLDAAKVGVGKSCTWYAVEPAGYVCAGGLEATTDPTDPGYREALANAPDLESPWPFQYAESIGAPRYDALPTRERQLAKEPGLAEHLALAERLAKVADRPVGVTFPPLNPKFGAKGEEAVEGVDFTKTGRALPLFGPVPRYAREARDKAIQGSTVAYQRTFEDADGRTWAQTSDHWFVPRDKLRPYPRSPFQGVELGEREQLPLAFFRLAERPKYQRSGDAFTATGATWPRLAHVGLTGKSATVGGVEYLETKEPGVWVAAKDAVVPKASAPPSEALLDPKRGRGTWIEVSTLGGWMIAYERDKPVFTTLVSAGRGGLPTKGVSPRKTASTPLGLFPIGGKFRTATMTSTTNTALVHTEVNFVQNFSGPFALHGAYWHDEFGNLRSAGCLNLSPLDAKRMYEWTEPKVPEGWYGIRSSALGEPTVMLVHK